MKSSLPFSIVLALSFYLPAHWIFTILIPLCYTFPVYKAFDQKTGDGGLEQFPDLTELEKHHILAFAKTQNTAAMQNKILLLTFVVAGFLLMNFYLGWDDFHAKLPAPFFTTGPPVLLSLFLIQHLADSGMTAHQNSIVTLAKDRIKRTKRATRSAQNEAMRAGRIVDDQGVHQLM